MGFCICAAANWPDLKRPANCWSELFWTEAWSRPAESGTARTTSPPAVGQKPEKPDKKLLLHTRTSFCCSAATCGYESFRSEISYYLHICSVGIIRYCCAAGGWNATNNAICDQKKPFVNSPQSLWHTITQCCSLSEPRRSRKWTHSRTVSVKKRLMGNEEEKAASLIVGEGRSQAENKEAPTLRRNTFFLTCPAAEQTDESWRPDVSLFKYEVMDPLTQEVYIWTNSFFGI